MSHCRPVSSPPRSARRREQLFAIEVSDGTQVLALPKAIQRDPIKDSFEHVDLSWSAAASRSPSRFRSG